MSYVYLGVASVISVSTRDVGVLMLPCVVGAGFMSLRVVGHGGFWVPWPRSQGWIHEPHVRGTWKAMCLLPHVLGLTYILGIRSMSLRIGGSAGS